MDKKKIEMAAEEYTAKHFLNDAEHLLKIRGRKQENGTKRH